MANVSLLKSSLKNLQVNPPLTQADAAKDWASAYHSYAQSLLANGVMVPTGLNKGVIEGQLTLVAGPNFFALFGSAIAAYWAPVLWVAPGFTGTTASAVGATGFLMAASEKIKTIEDPELAASEMANAINSHAMTITTTMVNVSTGVTVVVKLL